MLLVNTFDVEPWWTTVPPCVDLRDWSAMPDRSERPLRQFLDLCDEARVECTFFFIGWYAKQYPDRVREVAARGHEIGCHALFHEDVATQDAAAFERTTRDAKAILEDVAGTPVQSYRAPSFSFPFHRWSELFATLERLGFRIDSSVSTASRLYGGAGPATGFDVPTRLEGRFGCKLLEVPVPGVRIAGRELQVFGGGYLRLTPPALLERFARSERYQVLYLHPHDFDDKLPPLPGKGRLFQLRRKISIGHLERKVTRLYAMSDVKSCRQLLIESENRVEGL